MAEIRQSLGNSFTKSEFEAISRGSVISRHLEEELRRIETSVYKVLAYPMKYAKSRTRKWVYESLGDADYKTILKLLGRDLFDLDNVLVSGIDMSEIFVRDNLQRLTRIVSDLDRSDLQSLGVDAVRDIGVGYRRLLTTSVAEAYGRVTSAAREQIADTSCEVDVELIPYFEKRFSLNIQIVDGSTGAPVPNPCPRARDYDTVLLLASGGGFECLGIEVGENGLKCRFEPGHPFIHTPQQSRTQTAHHYDEDYDDSDSGETRSPSPER